MPGRLRRALSAEDGQALVELALAVPILLIVLLAIVDFGRAINYWNSENSLANVGARYAAVGATLPTSGACSGSTSTLAAYIQCEAGQYGLKNAPAAGKPGLQPPTSGSTVNVCVSVPNNTAGQPVTVKVYGQYDWLPLPHVFGIRPHINNLTLTGSATMRIENTVPTSWITTPSC
jgi:Flp pilus assembly protein TadG